MPLPAQESARKDEVVVDKKTEAVIKGNTAVFLVADSGGATAVITTVVIRLRRICPTVFARWRETIKQRPAVQRGVDLGKDLRRSAPPTDDERCVLFNQTAQDVLRRP